MPNRAGVTGGAAIRKPGLVMTGVLLLRGRDEAM
jgi:hypothetical protein